MQLCKVQRANQQAQVGILDGGQVRLLPHPSPTLSDILHAADPAARIQDLLPYCEPAVPLESLTLLPPLDQQEVWAAGVTYRRSREARERESVGAARFYDLVYTADRPELFFKATPRRVSGPGGIVRVRQDSRWSVPEPELALVISPQLRIAGYTIGNDMSARDIEGENPLYLPQAKVYHGACAIGPAITLAGALPAPEQVQIRMSISRGGSVVFDGSTDLTAMARSLEDLVAWLGRENDFPDGVILLTGTGIVPPDHFTLAGGDEIAIEIKGIGRLVNRVQ